MTITFAGREIFRLFDQNTQSIFSVSDQSTANLHHDAQILPVGAKPVYTKKSMAQAEKSFSVVKLSCSRRPEDRYLSAEADPLAVAGREVVLVSLIEIANRWQTAIDLGNVIRQTFVKTFRESPQRSVLTKFESSLKAINAQLDQAAATVVEPIHCALAIFTDGQLYFSTINNGHILLWRRQKLSQITGPHLASERFASVTSGDLKKDDWVVLGSLELRTLLKTNEDEDWNGEDKPALLRELGNAIAPAGYDQLAGIAVETSPEYQFKNVQLTAPVGPKAAATPAVAIWLGRIAYQFKKLAKFLPKRKAPDHPITDEPAKKSEAAPPPSAKRFPYRGAIAAAAVIALIGAGIGIIHYEFRKVGKVPTVVTPTIAALITKAPAEQLFSFIEQNLTVDNYKHLSSTEREQFNKTLASHNIGLITDSAAQFTIDQPIAALDTTANNLYLLDATGQLWRAGTEASKMPQQALITNPVDLTAMSDNKIVASDQAGQVWLYDNSNNQPIIIPLPPSLTQGPKLVGKYGSSNLYLYQTVTNTAYKVGGFIRDIFPESLAPAEPNAEPPAPPAPFITGDILNFGALADWLIPGDFYGATQDGVIKNFTKGAIGSFSVNYYQDNTPIHLSATAKETEIAVARGKFISIYSTETGEKISEKVIVTDSLISAVSLNPHGELLAATGKTIYKIQ